MVHKTLISIDTFNKCGQILREVHGKGNTKKINVLHNARLALLSIIAEIVDACAHDKDSKFAPKVHQALRYLHPNRSYWSNEKLLRDLLDIATTLRACESGMQRKSGDRISEAVVFCAFMCEALSSES